jgi:hypothetical protein
MVLTYLFALAFLGYKVSCRVEHSFHGLRHMFQRPDILQRIAYQSKRGQSKLLPTMHFDTNSFIIGIKSFASVTMAIQPDPFDDLILHTGQSVQGIQGGLSIKGHGTFKFSIKDDEGMVKIPNCMYVPDLKYFLLLPQHWAQTAPDSIQGTRMETDSECVILTWGQGQHQRTVPHSRDTNTLVFWTAPATSTYQGFVACIKAIESQFCQQEHVLQLPGRRHLMHNEDDKFLAEENILLTNSYCKNDTSVSEGAGTNVKTIQASN